MKYPEIISASAGSGKTYTITELIYELVNEGQVTADKIIATTFTIKAAQELKGRIREKLIAGGKTREANQMNEALIGTINSVCLKLLKKFAFEAGLSPDLKTMDENDQKVILRELIGNVLDDDFTELALKLGQAESSNFYFPGTPYLDQIEAIILQVKVNDISVEDLDSFGEDSVKEFFGLFPKKTKKHEPVRKKIITLLKQGIQHAKTCEHSAGSKKDLTKLQSILDNLKNDNFTWAEWISLKKKILAAKYLPENFIPDLDELVGDLTADLQFREDYGRYVKRCFTYAREVIAAYNSYKEKRGLLDFADQEALLYKLLKENQSVRDYLSKAYELVVVDEFQDVSPLQLDIFLRLTQLTQRNVWVGDPKQSIYAFRGADPQLMHSVVSEIPVEQRKQLEFSYRSRKPLVEFTNAIFATAFSETMAESAIVLDQAPKDRTHRQENEEELFEPAINYWKITGQGRGATIPKSLATLAQKIKQLLAQEVQVFDKHTSSYRPATYGDISILCRSNVRCQEIGQALTAAGLPVATSGFGLIAEAEIVFISALLKLLVFPGDTLAKAEALLYAHYGGDQEALLNDRLNAEDSYAWQKENPLLTGLDTVKEQLHNLPPARTIETLVQALELEQLFVSWGNLDQRLANVDALIAHAEDYQATCARIQSASTLAGFLNWMQQLSRTNEDYKGVQSGDVVQVMTYHRSKGLEWGIVMLWDLGMKPWDRFFGVKVRSNSKVDIADPLADRALRLFIKPYNVTSKYESFDEPLERSPLVQATVSERDAEESRLFYVAMTRARDYLFLCSFKDKFDIPDLVNPELNQLGLEDGLQTSSLSWAGQPLKVQMETIELLTDIEQTETEAAASRIYFATPIGRQEHPPLRLNPSSQPKLPTATIKGSDLLHSRHYVNRHQVSDSELGTFVHDLYCAYDERLSEAATHTWVTQYLTASKFQGLIEVEWMSNTLLAFHAFLKETYVDYKLHKELPIQAIDKQGRYVEGFVDLVVEVGDVLLVIDYKTFVTEEYVADKYAAKALSFSGQLGLYKAVLEQSFGKKVVGSFVYFVFEGRVLEVLI